MRVDDVNSESGEQQLCRQEAAEARVRSVATREERPEVLAMSS